MADGGTGIGAARDVPQGIIRRENADQIVIGCLISVACGLHDDHNRELALHLLARALPLSSGASRMMALRPLAEALLDVAPRRGKPGGGAEWCRVRMDLGVALSRDALARALAKIEV